MIKFINDFKINNFNNENKKENKLLKTVNNISYGTGGALLGGTLLAKASNKVFKLKKGGWIPIREGSRLLGAGLGSYGTLKGFNYVRNKFNKNKTK